LTAKTEQVTWCDNRFLSCRLHDKKNRSTALLVSCCTLARCKRDRFGRDELSADVLRAGPADNRCVEGNSDAAWLGLAWRWALMHAVLVEPLDSSGGAAGRDASRDLGRFTGDQPPAISRAWRSATGSWFVGSDGRPVAVASQSVIPQTCFYYCRTAASTGTCLSPTQTHQLLCQQYWPLPVSQLAAHGQQ